jgi:hypothetical protein
MRCAVTLELLPAAFLAARDSARQSAAYGSAEPPRNTCRYCGKFWKPWPGSRLDGHSRCIVPRSFQDEIAVLWRSGAQITLPQIAALCGVTFAVARAWTCPRNEERAA